MSEKIITSSNSEEIPKTKLALEEKYSKLDEDKDAAYERLKTKNSRDRKSEAWIKSCKSQKIILR